MRLLRTLPLLLFSFAVVASNQSLSQTPTAAARIVERIDESLLVPLKGNTLPAANAANDRGRVSPSLPMSNMVLVLARSPEQQAAFDQFVSSQYDASSPDFHHWLQPSEVGERFGPSLTDIATLSNWLAGRGFSVSGVSKDRMTLRFSGNAAQVQAAFHTEIHTLSVRGEVHIANISDPQIPMALAPVVAGVKGLHDFKPHPLHKMGATVSRDSQTGKWQPTNLTPSLKTAGASVAALKARPDFGITIGTGSSAIPFEDVSPYDFATIYNVLPLWTATTPINGTGQTIAVAGTSDINVADVASFRSAFGLAAGLTPIQVKGANGLDPGMCTGTTGNCNLGDLTENTLDVEWSGAVAPGAQVVLVTSGAQSNSDDTVFDSSDYVVQNLGVSGSPVANAHILTVSYGLCELGEGTSGNAAYNNLWQTASAEGIAVFVATGDAGAATCDQGMDTTVPYAAQYGLSVNGIASTPYNTAVGGTDLNWGATASPYWNATNASNGSSAKGYMPEVPWNDTCTNPLAITFFQNTVAPALVKAGFNAVAPTDAESSCQFVITWNSTVNNTFGVDLSSYVDVVGGGGGASGCTTSDGATAASCSGGYPKPSWQNGLTATDGKRDLPDVSFFAGNGLLDSAYLMCVSAALPTGVTACTYPTTAPGGNDVPDEELNAEEVGGTSVASPAMAGVMALINQKAGAPQGSPNAALYTLAGQQSYGSCKTEGPPGASCYFNDVDTGTISMPCQPGTANCTVAHSGDTVAVLAGYSASSSYDLASGLGTLNVANVVNAWTVSTTGAGAATVTVSPSATTIAVNQTLTVTVTVAGSGGTPTGTVKLVAPGYTSTSQTLASGTATFNIAAYGLSGGSDLLTVGYAGDSNYALTSGHATVTVSKLNSGGITVTPSAASIPANSAFTVTGTVSGSAGSPTPTGTVTLSSGTFSSPAVLTAGNYSISVPASTFAAGAITLTAAYGGDGNYLAVSNTAGVTITQPTVVTYAVAASTPAAVTRGSSATSTITVSSTSGYAGTVSLACAATSGPTNQTGDAPTCTVSAVKSVTLSAGTASGTVTVTVSTVAATTGALARPALRHDRDRLTLAGLGSAGLALLILFGIPKQRRAFRSLLGMLALVLALGSLAACGGGGGGSGGGGGTTTTNPGTASGAYVFTVTGTGTPAITPAPTATFTVTVN